MLSDEQQDDDIRNADAVVLIDRARGWQEVVGPVQAGLLSIDGRRVQHSDLVLHIPVGSWNHGVVQAWRERILRLRAKWPHA